MPAIPAGLEPFMLSAFYAPTVLLAVAIWWASGRAGLPGVKRAIAWLVAVAVLVSWQWLGETLARAGVFINAPDRVGPWMGVAVVLPVTLGLAAVEVIDEEGLYLLGHDCCSVPVVNPMHQRRQSRVLQTCNHIGVPLCGRPSRNESPGDGDTGRRHSGGYGSNATSAVSSANHVPRGGRISSCTDRLTHNTSPAGERPKGTGSAPWFCLSLRCAGLWSGSAHARTSSTHARSGIWATSSRSLRRTALLKSTDG